jgi:hypothetical protein
MSLQCGAQISYVFVLKLILTIRDIYSAQLESRRSDALRNLSHYSPWKGEHIEGYCPLDNVHLQ